MDNFLGYNFIWFFGVVEDRNDPEKLGRVRVRCFGWHKEDKEMLPTDNLVWSQVMSPIQSASMGDIGFSPTGLVEGSWVFGFFMDGDTAQNPLIIGSLPGKSSEGPNPRLGFNDPNGVYPNRVGSPDVNRLARNDPSDPHPNASLNQNSEYPHNHVHETEGGHIHEIDDTPGAKRIRTRHASGTSEEILNDGSRVVNVVNDNYTIVAGEDTITISGAYNLTVNGNVKVDSEGGITIEAGSDITLDGSNIKLTGGKIDVVGQLRLSRKAVSVPGLS